MNAPVIDAEKAHNIEASSDTPSDDGLHYSSYEDKPSFLTRLGVTPASFKRRTLADEHNQLNQTLEGRHLHMIAIGGSIGAGLFVGSGGALANGGPAALLIGFGIMGIVSLSVLPTQTPHTNACPR